MRDYGLVPAARSWPGKGRPVLQGRAIVGPDVHRAVLSAVLVGAPGCCVLGAVAWEIWTENKAVAPFVVGVMLLALALCLLAALALSNPGFLPKQNAHFALGPVGTKPLTDIDFNPQKFLDIAVNGALLRLKFCRVCRILRPPRMSHCGRCGMCVEKFDHHCPWVSNCIGLRNYRLFLVFISVLTVTEGYMWMTCLGLILATHERNGDWASTIKQAASAVVLGSYSLAVSSTQLFAFVSCLTAFHVFLITQNETTYERLKKVWLIRGGNNPFHSGSLLENCRNVLFAPHPPARFNLRDTIDLASDKIAKGAKQLFFSSEKLEELTDSSYPHKQLITTLCENPTIPAAISTREGTAEGLITSMTFAGV